MSAIIDNGDRHRQLLRHRLLPTGFGEDTYILMGQTWLLSHDLSPKDYALNALTPASGALYRTGIAHAAIGQNGNANGPSQETDECQTRRDARVVIEDVIRQ